MSVARIKIVCPNLTGHDCTITYVGTDEVEVDISNVVKAVTFKARVGEVNEATLELVKVEANVEGEAPPELTGLGDTYHRYAKEAE